MQPRTAQVAQGVVSIFTVTVLDTTGRPISYSGTEPLRAIVWPGGTTAITFEPEASWNDPAAGKVDIRFPAEMTAGVLAGYYCLRLELADSSEWLFEGFVDLEASPGAGNGLPGLCTVPFAHLALAGSAFSDDQWDYLDSAIAAASAVIRKYCGRVFTRRTITQLVCPEYDGRIRLDEIPINAVLRVASSPTPALRIACDPATSQQARVWFATTGDRETGLTVQGLNLQRVSAGVAVTATLDFATYPTLDVLAEAVTALGNGWSATVEGDLGAWASSELVGGEVGRGCLGTGAVLEVYDEDLAVVAVAANTGMLWVGNGGTSVLASDPYFWGPGAGALAAAKAVASSVRITYDAGFDTVPMPIQTACVDLAKEILIRQESDPTLQSETDGTYSYTLRDSSATPAAGAVGMLSLMSRQALALFRIHNA